MRWEIETWRKIYTGKPASWLALPVSARGLGRELLTYCDDKGRIPLSGESPGPAIARLLGAHRQEQKRLDTDVAELLKDGYLVLDGDAIVIRNYPQAQERSGSAERQRRYRARVNGDTSERNALRSPLRYTSNAGDMSRSDGSRSRSGSPLPPAERGVTDFPDPEPGSVPSSGNGSPRQLGTSPRQTGTNPRALVPIGAPPPPSEPYAEPPPPPPRLAVLDCHPSPPGSLASLFSDPPAEPLNGASSTPEEAVQ